MAAALVSWVFVIDPAQAVVAGPLTSFFAAAYPAGDLLLIVLGTRLALGASALHPSMARLGERATAAAPNASPARLVLLALASLLAPLTLVVQDLRKADLHVLLVAGCCAAICLLVVARLANLVQAQRHAAITDGLTGLHTRRYFEEALTTECARAARGPEPLSLVILDIDHFKKVNDTLGHSGGDRVLRGVAARIKATVRGGDVVARYGGEEFVILLPRTSPGDAYRAAERLRGVIEEQTSVTVSLGVATLPVHAETAEELVLVADRLLYLSKENGRNRVSGSEPPTAPLVRSAAG